MKKQHDSGPTVVAVARPSRSLYRAFRCEARHTLKLAMPLIIGQASNVAMSFIDTLMAGRLSVLDLAAVAIGSTVWTSLTLFLIGTLLTVPAFVAQYDGADQREEMAVFVRQAIWVALGLAALVGLGVRHSGAALRWIGLEPDVIPLADAYLDAISWGTPALAGYLVLRFLSDGLGRPGPTMYIGVFGLLLNIPADYLLMYGKWGFPALGAEGCGWATAAVLWLQLIVMAAYVGKARPYRFLALFRHWQLPDSARIMELLRVGLPVGAAVFVESSLFMVATLLMGSLGTIAVAGHQIAINFAALTFMVPLGIALAITVRVGNAAGRGEWREVRFRGWSGLALTLITQSVSASAMLLFPAWIASLYTTDTAVSMIAVSLLFYAAIFQFSDGIQVAAAAALRGIKDTRIPMLLMIGAYWVIGIPLSYWLGISLKQEGAGIWIGLIGGLTVAAAALSYRFRALAQGRILRMDAAKDWTASASR